MRANFRSSQIRLAFNTGIKKATTKVVVQMSDGVHAVAHVSSSDSSARVQHKLALPLDLVEPSDGVHAVAHVSSSDSSARVQNNLALPFDLVEPSDGVHAVTHVSSSGSRTRVRHKLALLFDLVEPSVAAVDVAVVVTASVFAGLGYHWFFLNYVPNVIPYVLIGAFASLNFV